MFADLDETIRQLLIRHVPVDLAEVDVSFDAPDREWSGRLSRPTINCYLYDIRENLDLREFDYEVTRSRANGFASKHRTPLRFDTTYNVTVWARAPEDEHRLLWRVLRAFARYAILPDEVLGGRLRDQPFPVPTKVAKPDYTPISAADLWQAVDNRIRPSLTYVVTLALDPEEELTAPLVFTREMRLEPLIEAAGVDETLYQIGGRVTEKGGDRKPIVGAMVRARASGAVATSDDDGYFMLRNVQSGDATLVVLASGRQTTLQVRVPSPRYDLEV